ncbi:MAG: adenosylhomocysteinase [Dehalococcoidia bacterium]|nr:adenosylhomocysteinase [Dehalococcoidia bacterium]MDP7470583.1 adenosylhomocysteinase [Dehalococcoidia bacterium]
MSSQSKGDVKDRSLSKEGIYRIEWAGREMPVLSLISKRFQKERPLEGLKVSGCLHITSETANLALVLKAGGAVLEMCASNPLSTQDEVAAALVTEYGVPTYAIKGEDDDTYYRHLSAVLDHKPNATMDDGADLIANIHQKRRELIEGIIGGTEETTTGVIRLRALAKEGRLEYPIIAVNEADTKHLFDNRYGTGQSTIDGITRVTNVLWAGKKVVVCGYGWCGRGIAMRARGMGSQVIVIEVEPIPALEAIMDGFQVMPLLEAAPLGDIFITATGGTSVIDRSHFEVMKDKALLANSGHFNVEIDLPALETLAANRKSTRPLVEEYALRDGRRLYVLAEGRLVNLAAAEGHPASVMDMSFANQALALEYLATGERLAPDVYVVPEAIDREVGRLKLKSLGISIDSLTAEQQRYLASWEMGT